MTSVEKAPVKPQLRKYCESKADRICDVLYFAHRRKVWFTVYEIMKLTGLSLSAVRAGLYREKVKASGLLRRTCKPRRGCVSEYQIRSPRWSNPKRRPMDSQQNRATQQGKES